MRWNPFRRQRPTGRHARPVYPTGPSAAATLVVVAAGAAAASSAPTPEPNPAPSPFLAPAAEDAAPDSPEALGAVTGVGLEEVPMAPGAVGLGFTDGAAVELAQDDPRAASLRAAAAALLEHPAP
jgi:hypothetical protein